MLRNMVLVLAAMVALAAGQAASTGTPKGGDGEKQPAGGPEEKAIAQTLTKVADAYNKGDAEALAAAWSDKGVYISHKTGDQVKGRDSIEKEFAAQFAQNKNAKLSMEIQSIRLITPDVAMLDGSAHVVKGGSARESTFTMILTKNKGQWLIDSVRETETPSVQTGADHLKDLEWLIGEWQFKDNDSEVRIVSEWFADKNFMARQFSVLGPKGEVMHQGLQVVGWDAGAQKIRSWVFESDGTFGEGTWTKKDKQWSVKVTGMLPSGQKSMATQILTKVDADHYKWKVIARTVAGEMLPNVDEVTLTRQPAAASKEGE